MMGAEVVPMFQSESKERIREVARERIAFAQGVIACAASATVVHLVAGDSVMAAAYEQTAIAHRVRVVKLDALLRELDSHPYDHCPGEAALLVLIEKGFGERAEFLSVHAQRERDVVDAFRCCGTLGAAANGSGASLHAWVGLSADERREKVREWHRSGRGSSSGALPRLVPGAVWPTSTFDPFPLACSFVRQRQHRSGLLLCSEPEGHAGAHVDETGLPLSG
jgi:hypothetical protein